MKKKISTYSNSKTHKKFNFLIKNKLKVKMKPGSIKFQCTGEDLSNLGFISSLGGSHFNSDYLNIYTKIIKNNLKLNKMKIIIIKNRLVY